MDTPICDFVRDYSKSKAIRLHMPGHKGKTYLGPEIIDITEIDGADSLYEADGIIYRSEKNAGLLFGADTFYSCGGSTLCIQAMLYLVSSYAKERGMKPVIAAGRNAHKAFLNIAALLDFEVQWIFGEEDDTYLSCNINYKKLEKLFMNSKNKPVAVYITSPDYLGNVADIKEISAVCKKYGILLLVDNAHGAYLKFLEKSMHPLDLGADMCCDSAHKTLPVLTGGAYLHISKSASECFSEQAKFALGLFGSTSPSYLILQSLDLANQYLYEGYRQKLSEFLKKSDALKDKLMQKGFCLIGDEPLKLALAPKSYGYTGIEFAEELKKKKIICEFADYDFTVLMLTPELGDDQLRKLENTILQIPEREANKEKPPCIPIPQRVMSVNEALFSKKEEIYVDKALGRVLANVNIACPPAVPVIVCGERIDEKTIECFKYYGIKKCTVVK